MSVTVEPLPQWARKVSRRLRPVHKPLFENPPTRADVELALALIAELDPESRQWYSATEALLRERLRTK